MQVRMAKTNAFHKYPCETPRVEGATRETTLGEIADALHVAGVKVGITYLTEAINQRFRMVAVDKEHYRQHKPR